jgi:transcriptional regulator with XRE-family HTH domain
MDSANHLKAWRKFRRMTLEQVGDAIGTTKAVIQQLESGRMALSHKWLLKLAPVFGTTPGFLLDHDPTDIDAAFLDAAMSVPKERRAQAVEILATFRKAGKA